VYINNATVVNVYVTNELTTTFSITVSYHNGNGAGETDLGTVVITSAKGGAVPVSWPVPTNTQIAVKVALSTANSPKNIVVGLALSGTN
jgi:phenolic acid decarboxylase